MAAMARGREAAVMRGGGLKSGPIPYGYRRTGPDYVIHEEEAAVIQRIFKLYLRWGASLKTVIDAPHRDGLRTKRGAEWSRCGLSWILKNQFYVGVVKYGRARAMGNHTPIVARITFNLVQVKLKRNRRN